MELQIGDLIFVSGRNWLDRAIEWITKSKYSHVAIYVGDGLVIEAQGFRTTGFQALSYYEGKYDVFRYKRMLTDLEKQLIVGYLNKQIGDSYDYFDIFIQMLRYLFKLKLPWHEYHRFICSTLARNAYKIAGLRVPKGNVSPEDLAEWPMFYQVS